MARVIQKSAADIPLLTAERTAELNSLRARGLQSDDPDNPPMTPEQLAEMAPRKARGQPALDPQGIVALRERLQMTEDAFAAVLEVSVPTLRGWQEGRWHPHGPARALLRAMAANPGAVLDALRG
jgi:DNA-binding transcriptional regulator YiaG